MPVLIGLLYLNTRRTLLEKYNLLAVGSSHGALIDPKDQFMYRTGDGKYNDPDNAEAGSQYTFFGRNMKPVDQEYEVLLIFIQNSKF
jgi:alpha-dioxygenase